MNYSDLEFCYLINSSCGNQHILICYDYDSNAILAEAVPSRSGARINKGVQKSLTHSQLLDTSPSSIKLIMKLVIYSRISSLIEISTIRLFSYISISGMPQKEPFVILKTTLLQVSAQLIPNIYHKNGNTYSHRPP